MWKSWTIMPLFPSDLIITFTILRQKWRQIKTLLKKKKTLLDTENASELHEYLGFKEMKIEGFKVVWLRLILNHGI